MYYKKIIQILASDISHDILNAAKKVIELAYDLKTESELLSILKKAYDETKGVTADTNWDENIKNNKEKMEKIKQSRQERNLKAKKYYDKKKVPTTPFEKKLFQKLGDSPTKKAVKDKVENLIKVDFQQKKPSDQRKVIDKMVEYGQMDQARAERIKLSLDKINYLMSELKKKSEEK